MPSPLGDKMRTLRKQKRLSLEQLAELTDSSKSYIWELENKDVPKPSADKIGRIAAVLDVTSDYLLSTETSSPDQQVLDLPFNQKCQGMPDDAMARLRQILDAWDNDE